ncbi:Single-stranded DNA-binding protein [Caldanaerobius fijiensis DSM 17918]|uniref:Single-stranded DNA-binding protein n=1 Tax=Caldanaerobius fijiensis DSM 17918 TaxID=1121256 RepID=A0A1M5DDN1_9THEO|nr:single-stranded DNA-binding protein [Caldanaerobius fijiensis]SHF65025.1 Single-stranded DNA-binding protein [Caldanaerobius fijiensis DSM 17918]
MANQLANNVVNIVGKIISDLEYGYELFGEVFYQTTIEVPRLSESKDLLPLTISERLIPGMDIKKGARLKIEGQLRSYNRTTEDGKRHLVLTVFVRDLKVIGDDEVVKNPNEIFIDGYICKKPVYRSTPFGREITDLLIAVNRAYRKSDYIPVIAWGRNARYSEKLKVGDRIRLWGRIQSREYQKRISEDEVVTKTAYEVSISKMEKVDNGNKVKENDE